MASSSPAAAEFRIPHNLGKTIQSIREVVGNHADEDIYEALKEAKMDPNEATQQLLTQEPFHEVKRKNRRRENNVSNLKNFDGHPGPQTRTQFNGHPGPQSRPQFNGHPGHQSRPQFNGHPGHQARPQFNGPPGHQARPEFNGPPGHQAKPQTRPQLNGPPGLRPRPQLNGPPGPPVTRHQLDGHPAPMTRPQGTWERNSHRDAYSRNDLRSRPLIQGKTREFRIVKDNRVNRKDTETIKPAAQDTASNHPTSTTASNHPTSTTALKSQILVGEKQILIEEKRAVPRSDVRLMGQRSNTSSSTTLASSNSVVGVYSKSTDPVHVPSPNSRPSGSIGAIKREVGVVGSQRITTQTTLVNSAAQSENFSASPSKGSAAPAATLGKISGTKGANQVSEAVGPTATNFAHNKSFTGNQHSSKVPQQQSHQRSSAPIKEWKPKSTQRSNANSDDVGGKPAEYIPSHVDDDSSVRKLEIAGLPGKLSEVILSTDEHVIIAQHLLVPEADRCRLTFGSFGIDVDSSKGSGHEFQAFTEEFVQKDEHLSFSNPIAGADDNSAGDRVDLLNGHSRMSGSDTPASIGVLEAANFPDEGYSVSPQDLNDYSDIGLVQNELQQEEDAGALNNFSEYSQMGYSTPFFKPAMEDNLRQGLAPPQEALGSHPINGAPASTHLTQQQQQSVTQMYPQVQLAHIPNFIPYRPVYPPVYVPPMAVPNFSNTPAYSLPSSGNNYVVMPGGSSHVSTGTIKYGPSLFKGAAPGGPVGYGSYTNQAGFISTPGVVGATGLDELSRSKYKDGNMFMPSQQVDTSEMWVQTPREVSGMQSGPYYGMSGQAPHAAYMHSPAGPASYNTPAPQSQHLQFPGMYHQPQPPTMANPHHMVHPQVPMAGNVPGAQVGAYQQPQLGWNTNY